MVRPTSGIFVAKEDLVSGHVNWRTGGLLKTYSFLSETNKQLGMILACGAMPIGTSMNKDKL